MNRTLRLLPALLGLWILSCTPPEPPTGQAAYTATDDLGRQVSLTHAPSRIISLAPSITETVFALGLDSALVGVTEYCDYPPAAALRTRVGGMLNPALEVIVKLRPDLVLMSGSGNMQSDFTRLTGLGLTVFVSHPRDFQGILKSIGDLGSLTGTRPQADALKAIMLAEAERLERLAAEKTPHSVLVLVSVRPVIAAGPGTFIDQAIRLCNSTNIASRAGTAYPMLSREEILTANPDRIIVTSDALKDPSELPDILQEWRTLRAVTDSAVALVDADKVTRPGPRIVEGLWELFGAIHGQRPQP